MWKISSILLASALSLTAPNANTPTIDTITNTNSDVSRVLKQENTKNKINILANKYLLKHTIQRWESLKFISNKYDISINELSYIREITEKLDKKRKIDFLIAWETIFVPENYEDFLRFKDEVNEYEIELNNQRNNKLYEEWNIEWLENNIEYNIFPNKAQKIWIKKISEALINNMKYSFRPYNPQFVDVKYEKEVNCAGMMRAFYSSAIPEKNRSRQMSRYALTQNVDAWELPMYMQKIWFTRTHNLMKYFDSSRIWKREIVADENWYFDELLEIWNEFNKWKISVWSMIPAYFKLSHYKWIVKKYNSWKDKENQSINTHAMIYLWNWELNIEASEVKNVVNWKIIEEWFNSKDIKDFIIDFVQQRWWYNSCLSNKTKNIIIERLNFFSSLINIYVNWKKINLSNELKLAKDERFKINYTDKIRIEWAIVWDWFHDVISKNPEISKENNFRTMFFFEPLLIDSYTFSEVLENHGLEKNTKSDFTTEVIDELKIANLYDLKFWEKLSTKVKEAILRYWFNKEDELKITNEELLLAKSIKSNISNNEKRELNFKLIQIREKKIQATIWLLSNKERRKFNLEYKNQIKGLELYWYMQNEWKVNPWTTNINAPIPFFNTSNIEDIFKVYIDHKRQEFRVLQNENTDKEFITVLFLEWDNSTIIYNEIYELLKININKYQNFSLLLWLNELQRRYFLDKIIDQKSSNKNVDVSNWKIPSNTKIIIWLDEINNLLEIIKKQSFITKIKVSELDETIIDLVGNTETEKDIMRQKIAQEGYMNENRIAKRIVLKVIARYIWRSSSYWDFQLRFMNLRTKNALNKWPTTENILEAIEYLESPKIREFLKRRELTFRDIINDDKRNIEIIKEKLTYINERNREKIWKEVYELLKNIFRFDDWTWSNIQWKIIIASLVKSKADWVMENLVNWVTKWWMQVDEVVNSDDLRYVIERLRLEVYNKSEKKTLIWITENYILRILSTVDDIRDSNYPKIKKNIIWKIDYIDNFQIIIEHYKEYKRIIRKLDIDDNIKKVLLKKLSNIINSKFSVDSLFDLMKDKELKEFLSQNWESTFFLPKRAELTGWVDVPNFRNIFFWYSRPALNKEATKINKLEYLYSTYEWQAILWFLFSTLWWLTFLARKKIKKIFTKKQKNNT